MPTPTEAKKRQNKPAHNNYFEGLAMLVMNFHLQSTLYKKLKSSIFVFLKTNSRNSVILLQSLLKNALIIFWLIGWRQKKWCLKACLERWRIRRIGIQSVGFGKESCPKLGHAENSKADNFSITRWKRAMLKSRPWSTRVKRCWLRQRLEMLYIEKVQTKLYFVTL